MIKKEIYIDISHCNYWWGIYNFTKLTEWEDVDIYEKNGEVFKKLARTCICTKEFFRNGLEELKEDEEDINYINKIEMFLNDINTYYDYHYDDPKDEDFYEVPFEAMRNEMQIKPRYIETWYPSEGIDKSVIDAVVKEFCEKFLNINVELVLYKDEVFIEEVRKEYVESVVDMQKCKGMIIAETLIEEMAAKMKITKERALELVEISIRG